ncbi:histidine kinase [Streptomyces albireticuli]|uniref:histidine kinase n=1 Tax=Streptomyces albireticuli TaxID=1940 RepID=UPI0036AF253E
MTRFPSPSSQETPRTTTTPAPDTPGRSTLYWLWFLRASHTTQNALIAAVLAPATLTLALHDSRPGLADEEPVRVAVAIGVLGLLFVHQRYPWLFALGAGADFFLNGTLLPMGVAAMAAVRLSRPVLATLSVIVPTAVNVWNPSLSYSGDPDLVLTLYRTLALLLLPLVIGALARTVLQASSLERRTYEQQAELDESRLREKRLQERTALARSVHNGLGRQSSLIALQAGVIRAQPEATPRIQELSKSIIDTATAAIREVRYFLNLVGYEAPAGTSSGGDTGTRISSDPGPALRAVVEQFRDVGLRIQAEFSPHAEDPSIRSSHSCSRRSPERPSPTSPGTHRALPCGSSFPGTRRRQPSPYGTARPTRPWSRGFRAPGTA